MTRSRNTGRTLRGRVALVAGATGGIGLAIALLLGASGARVIAVGRAPARIQAMCEEADARGIALEAVACDLTDDAAVQALATRIADAYGTLDILVHSAGTIGFGTVEDAPVAELDRMVDVNLRAPYVLTQVMVPLLRASKGDVVFINSSAGIRPSAGVAAYGATKHGLRGLADALRDELNPSGVRVTSIYAGRTRTPLLASVHRWEGREEPEQGLIEPEDIAAMVAAVLVLPRSAEVTDLHVRPARPPG